SVVGPGARRPTTHALARRDAIRRAAGHASDHGVLADPDILVDGAEPAENGVILNDDVTAQGCVVGHDDMVADLAVMRDVRPHHEQAVVADTSHHPATDRAGIHSHVFADPVIAPDNEFGGF